MRGQNTSSAVMQQRKEARDSLDDFPTPPWATRALCEYLKTLGFEMNGLANDPACNRGYMVAPLREYFGHVYGSDVHDYQAGFPTADFLIDPVIMTDWIITNPPFRLAEQFIDRALNACHVGCAMLVRSAFLEGRARYQNLFSINPPAYVMQFSERVVMHKGKLVQKGSSATAYSWVVFLRAPTGRPPEFHWIPPCRAQLERDSDYPGNRLTEDQVGALGI